MIYKPHRRVLYIDITFYIASSVLFYSSPLVRGTSHLVPAIHSVCYQNVFGAGLGWGRQNYCNNTCDIVNDIWNESYMNCGNEIKMKKWSSQWTQFMQLRKEARKKKFQAFNGVWTRDLAITGAMLYQLSLTKVDSVCSTGPMQE